MYIKKLIELFNLDIFDMYAIKHNAKYVQMVGGGVVMFAERCKTYVKTTIES